MDEMSWKVVEMIAKLFETYGLAATCVTLFSVWLLGMFWQHRVQGRIMNRFREELPWKMETGKQINDALDTLLFDLDCDRAAVYQYHNGNQNVCGVHFDKCSNTHERVQVGVAPQMMRLQNLPNSLFASWNTSMMRTKEIAASDIEELKASDLGLHQFLVEQGVKSFYLVGIFSFDGDPVGFVGINYCRHKRELGGEDMNRLRATAMKICGLVLAGKKEGR